MSKEKIILKIKKALGEQFDNLCETSPHFKIHKEIILEKLYKTLESVGKYNKPTIIACFINLYKIEYNELLNWHDAYEDGTPYVADSVYDYRYRYLKDLYKYFPKLVKGKNVFEKISLKDDYKHRHIVPMLSLANVYDTVLLEEWLDKTDNLIVEPKYDGMSINLVYNKGILIRAVTRGNGLHGDNILRNIRLYTDVKKNIEYKGYIEIRGEIIVDNRDFITLKERYEYKEPRTAVSGILNTKSYLPLPIKLKFKFWGIGHSDINVRSLEKLYEIFNHTEYKLITDKQEMNIEIDRILNKLSKRYPIDGVVFKINNFAKQRKLGYSKKYPNYAKAFKVQDEPVFSKIVDIEWSNGQKGLLNPVAIIEPIVIDNVDVTRVNLYNVKYIEDMDLRIGSKVGVIRSGKVIPKIVHVENNEECKKYTYPAKCPKCGSDTNIVETKSSKRLYCSNLDCK